MFVASRPRGKMSSREGHESGSTAQVQRECGLSTVVREMPASTRTAKEAAEAIGCGVGQIAKSLVFRGRESGRPLLVIVSGTNRVNEPRSPPWLANQLNARHLISSEKRPGMPSAVFLRSVFCDQGQFGWVGIVGLRANLGCGRNAVCSIFRTAEGIAASEWSCTGGREVRNIGF